MHMNSKDDALRALAAHGGYIAVDDEAAWGGQDHLKAWGR
jgi:hypothetical protein